MVWKGSNLVHIPNFFGTLWKGSNHGHIPNFFGTVWKGSNLGHFWHGMERVVGKDNLHVAMTADKRDVSKICLFVGNIPYSTTDIELEKAFKVYGPLRACYTVKDKG